MPCTVKEKYNIFLKNAKLLYGRFGIKPLLYGSLGLEVLLGKDLQSDDIDILIPTVFINEKWEEFKPFLEADGYILTDLHEHTFAKNGIHYSYARIEELNDFAGISSFTESEYCLFITLEGYLKVYSTSLRDSYRQNKKNKNDMEKIKIIKNALEGQ